MRRAFKGLGMPLQSKLADGAFAPEQVRLIVAAFEGAWHELQAANSQLTGAPYAAMARELLAKRIIDQARAILDSEALKDDALAYLREQMPP